MVTQVLVHVTVDRSYFLGKLLKPSTRLRRIIKKRECVKIDEPKQNNLLVFVCVLRRRLRLNVGQ